MMSRLTHPSSISAQERTPSTPPAQHSATNQRPPVSPPAELTAQCCGDGGAWGRAGGCAFGSFWAGACTVRWDRVNAKSNKLSVQAEGTRCPRGRLPSHGDARAGGGITTQHSSVVGPMAGPAKAVSRLVLQRMGPGSPQILPGSRLCFL